MMTTPDNAVRRALESLLGQLDRSPPDEAVARALVETGAPEIPGVWSRFLRARAHLVARGGRPALLQWARSEPPGSAVRRALESHLAAAPATGPWRTDRRGGVDPGVPLFTVERRGDDAVASLEFEGDRVLVVRCRRRVERWDLRSRSALAVVAVDEYGPWIVEQPWPGGARRAALVPARPSPPGAAAAAARVLALDDAAERAAGVTEDGQLAAWDLVTGTRLRNVAGEIARWARTPCVFAGRHLVAALAGGEVRAFDLGSDDGSRAVACGGEEPADVLAARDLACVVVHGPDGVLRIHAGDISNATPTGLPADAEVRLDPAGRHLCAFHEETLVLFDVASGRRQEVPAAHDEALCAAAFAPDGRLWTAGLDGALRRWDPATARREVVLRAHHPGPLGLAVHPAGVQVVSAGARTIRVWDGPAACGAASDRHPDPVTAVCLPAGGAGALSVSERRVVSSAPVARRRELRRFAPDGADLVDVRSLPDDLGPLAALVAGGAIAVHQARGGLLLVDTRSGARRLLAAPAGCFVGAASADGRSLATLREEGTAVHLERWDVATLALVGAASPVFTTARGLVLDAGACRAAVLGDGAVHLIHLEGGAGAPASCARGDFTAAAFVGAELIACGTIDGVVELRRADGGTPVARVQVPSDPIAALAWDADRALLVVAAGRALALLNPDGALQGTWTADADITACDARAGRIVFGSGTGEVVFLTLDDLSTPLAPPG
ncbi:WD40 repeat domain-containing protein [Sorangium sp. So ce1182]|uniref:WD40 repeat domain-containing protein n=1 Tax=Sorangium sp. So ce1182 TaxID=3133334 RepID=UPI003F5FF45B